MKKHKRYIPKINLTEKSKETNMIVASTSENEYINNSRNNSTNINNHSSFFRFIVGLCICFITYQGYFFLKNSNELIKVKLSSLRSLENWDIQIKELDEKLSKLNNESILSRVELIEANVANGTFDKNKLKDFVSLQEQVSSIEKNIYKSENKQNIKDFGILLQDFQLFKEQIKNEYQKDLYDYKLKTGGWFVSILATIILTSAGQIALQKIFAKKKTEALE